MTLPRLLLVTAALLTALVSACAPSEEPSQRVASAATSTSERAPSSSNTQAVLDAYIADMERVVACLRENGLPGVADPGPLGEVELDTRKLDDPKALARARSACQQVQVPMPPEVRALIEEDEAGALTEHEREAFAEYATCMQANGAEDFPDPMPNGLPAETGWDQSSPGGQRALAACAHLVGGRQGADVG